MALCPLVAIEAHAARPHPTSRHQAAAHPAVSRANLKSSAARVATRSAPETARRKGLPVMKVMLRGEITSKSSLRAGRLAMGKHSLLKGGKARYAPRYAVYQGGISCVPFARAASGIQLKGNAANWWDAAYGVYARGQAPEAGSVLNFRATGHMRLGHVAVVTHVMNAREVEIDHANWDGPGASKGGVSRGIPVIDVSANNDWSAVRVGLGHSGTYGSVYPTYGFIYDRPDNGTFATNHPRPTDGAPYDEVAEAPVRALR
ncbi:MAG TPA: CHAP domain-containing protein [Rhizomicrobium sp.]